MTSVSTHVLDTATGRPVVGMRVVLERSMDGGWQHVGEGETDVNGRIPMLAVALLSGVYRLVFETGDAGNGFYPQVQVTVDIDDDCDVPEMLARQLLIQNGPAWNALPHRARKRLRYYAKRWLNTQGVQRMTPALLAERDPAGEVQSWLTTMARLAEAK